MSYLAETRQRQALQLAEQIATVRAQLNELEAQFFALVGDGAAAHSTAQRSTPQPQASETSAAAQVLAVFARQPGKKVPVQAVVEELSKVNAGLIRSTAARFYRDGKLKRAGRGIYKYVLTQTPPNEETEG